MKLKLLTNIIAIFLITVIIGGTLYTWSKNNVEQFTNPSPDLLSKFDSVFNNILQTRLYANDYYDRVNILKSIMEKKGTVDGADYVNLIDTVKSKISDEAKKYDNKGKEIQREINNETIRKLEDDISYFDQKITNSLKKGSTTSNNIRSIKSVSSGINLNVVELKKILKPKTLAKKNLPTDSPIIMIHLNSGCLDYNPQQKIYKKKHCEVSKFNQYFIIKKIDNKDMLLPHLTGDYAELQENITGDDNLYPFNIICPISDRTKCLQIDFDGLSIIDCRPSTLNNKQRWITSGNVKFCN